MNQFQKIFIAASVGLTLLLFFFGRTIPDKKESSPPVATGQTGSANTYIPFEEFLAVSKENLSSFLLNQVEQKEKEIQTLADLNQKIDGYRSLANIWKDSTGSIVAYAKYMSEAAKLENSEKSLNFAAQLLLEEVLSFRQNPMKAWMAREARDLFEQQLLLRPDNDSAKIGLGTCYFFGAAKDGEPPMKGVMLIREIADRNPDNAYAQRMLGIGAVVSGQKDKAIERFQTVHRLEPDNIDVLRRLGMLYQQSGEKTEALKWYKELLIVMKRLEAEKKYTPGPEEISELERMIKTLEN